MMLFGMRSITNIKHRLEFVVAVLVTVVVRVVVMVLDNLTKTAA